jgi:O-antigen ligase
MPAIVIITTGVVAYFTAPEIFHHERMIAKINAALSTAEHPNIKRSSDDVAIGDEIRFENWHIAIVHLKQGSQPFFGIGPRQFDKIKSTDYIFDPPLKHTYKKLEHAHNLFLTKWVEEGLLGLLAFLYLLALFFNGIFFDRRDKVKQPWLWGAAFAAWVVPITSGFFGSPWKHEFAILAMLLFGLYFSHYVTAPDVSIDGTTKRT